jgi:hypothetical protein
MDIPAFPSFGAAFAEFAKSSATAIAPPKELSSDRASPLSSAELPVESATPA